MMKKLSRRQFLSVAAGSAASTSLLVGGNRVPALGDHANSADRHSGDWRAEVEVEEEVYSFEPANNGAAPMWCHGNSCVVRWGDEVFASGLETLPDYKPLNNCRWLLFRRASEGWELQQVDPRDRTREPCPLGCFPDGRLLMSVNPTLSTDPEAHVGPARPEILQFAATDPQSPAQTLLPEWSQPHRFTEHSYRSFATDGVNGELVLFQNIGYTHSCWAFLDSEGQWTTGKLLWLPREDPAKAPYGSTATRVNYPCVALKDRAVHFLGNSAYDQWERMPDVGDLQRKWGPRFRKLYYTWSDDLTRGSFADWIEIDNCFTTGGWLFSCDLHIAADGDVHMLWHENPIHLRLRDERFPDIERIWALKYAVVRRGQVILRRTLVSGGERGSPEIPGRGRFQVTPDGRLFVFYYVHGRDEAGEPVSQNRLIPLQPDGSHSPPITLAIQHPLTVFFTNTPRAGCQPSTTLDLLGVRAGTSQTISYARIRLHA